MKKSLLVSILFASISYGVVIPRTTMVDNSVVPNDKTYYIHKQDNIEIIYTKDNATFAKHTSKIEPYIHKNYENFYDWILDERLFVALVSENNQIANGFSTQLPNNRQINYMGGTEMVDYFTTTSWLDTLLYHESAHNYQVNVKASAVSQALHSIFGNGSFFMPTFIVPNYAENSFMLEGNAVLNESWHGNGGRLYSGRFYAQTILQAKADKIKPHEVYNSKVEFPYGEILYIQGGFYNLYMAQRYGLKSINSYFKYHSEDWYWPFYTNASMSQATGVNFEESLKDYSDEYKKISESLVMAEGKHIASSQFFKALNSDIDEIFFLTNESGRRAAELVQFDKKTSSVVKHRDSWSFGKPIKADGIYYTQASAHTSVTKIMQGLYDNNRLIKKGSASKMVQGYLNDGREVYFDVPSSYSEPQLFIAGEFYAKVNSSVFIDKEDNLYYFVQNEKKRTLYKNKTPLFSLQGFYSIVSDVDSKGGVYFVSNSEFGSSLYLFKDKKISRVSSADNIIDAKLVNDNEVLIAAISEKDYYYVTTSLESIANTPFEVKLFFEDKAYYSKKTDAKGYTKPLLDISEEYNSFFDMRYSGTDFMLANNINNSLVGSLNIKFGDPLTQNAMNFFATRDDNNITIAGLGYESALSVINYGLYAYSVVEKDVEVRDSGVLAFANLPLYKKGYVESLMQFSYYQDYDTVDREPLSLELSLSRNEIYGVSMYSNYLNYISAYVAQDREDSIYGTKYMFKHDLPNEVYLSLNAKYSACSNASVKVSNTLFSSDLDPSLIDMKSISEDIFVKNASYIDVGIAKVLNFSSYWFTFPLSFQREVVYVKYKYFDIKSFNDNVYNIAEITAGLSASVVFFNNVAIPIGIEYIYNDTFFAKDKNQIFFSIGSSF